MITFENNIDIDYKLAKKVYFSIFAITSFWLLMIFLAPLFLELGGVFSKISSLIYVFFSKVCHQDDSRSFHLLEHKLGVCSRCVWIYIGFFIATSLYPLKYKLNNSITPSVWFLIFAAVLLFLDVLFDKIGVLENTFLSRSVTGFIIGFVLPFYIIPGFVKFFYEIHSFLRNKASA